MIKVLGVGSALIDYIVKVDSLPLDIPVAGEKLITHHELNSLLSKHPSKPIPGGSAANTIRGLSSLGNEAAWLGKVGHDTCGKIFLDSLSNNSLAIRTNENTGQAICFVTPDGERSFCTYQGVSAQFLPADLKADFFKDVKIVHIEGYTLFNPGLTEAIMHMAKNAGAKISFDMCNYTLAEKFKDVLLTWFEKHVDILFTNEEEAFALTRLRGQQACLALKEVVPLSVVMMNKKGCWVGQGSQDVFCPTQPVVPVDSTGAGDLFISGFLHAHLKGLSLQECGNFGCLVAREVVQVEGAQLPPSTLKKLKHHTF